MLHFTKVLAGPCFLLVTISSAPAVSQTVEPGAPIRIGMSTNLSGPVSAKALQIKAGGDLVFNKVNASGGVNGRKVEVLYMDNAYDPRSSLDHTKTFIGEKKVFLLFGYYGTASVRAVLPTIEKESIPLVAPTASDESLRVPLKRMIFPVGTSSKVEIDKLAGLAVSKKELKSIALAYQDDGTGQAARSALIPKLRELGAKIEVEASIDRNSGNVDPAVEKIAKSKADAVFITGNPRVVMSFMKSATAKGYRPTYFVPGSATGAELGKLVEDLKLETYVTLKFPSISHRSSPLVQAYLKDVAAVGAKPDQSQIDGYVGATVLVEGLKRAGSTLTREKFIQAMESMSDFKVGEMQIHYSPKAHEGSEFVFLCKIVKGEYQHIEP